MYTWYYIYLVVFVCVFWINKYLLSTNIIDKFYRIVNNDFFFNNFYFFWTNLWYLPFIFFLIIVSFLIHKSLIVNNFIVIFIISYTWFNNIIFLNFYNSNIVNYHSLVFQEGLNTLLLNSINKIHPALLYTSTYIFFLVLFTISANVTHKQQYCSFMLLNFIKPIKYLIYISILTLFLGSWWATQEGSWGGWWNWDTSEVFGLLILFKILLYFHRNIFLNSLKLHWIHTLISFYILLSFYLFMQLNFNLISHNFGFHISKFINIEVFLLNLLFLIFIFTKIKVSKYRIYIFYYLYPVKKNVQSLTNVIFFIINVIFFITTLSLINDFFWINFTLNFFNSYTNFNFIICIMIIFLFISFKSNRFNYILFYFLMLSNPLHYVYIYLKNFKKTSIFVLHYLIFFSLLLTTTYHNITLNNWLNLHLVGFKSNVNTINYDMKNLWFQGSLILNSTSFEGKEFNLNLVSSILVQNFYPIEFNTMFIITIVDILAALLFVCFNMFGVIYLTRISKVIVF